MEWRFYRRGLRVGRNLPTELEVSGEFLSRYLFPLFFYESFFPRTVPVLVSTRMNEKRKESESATDEQSLEVSETPEVVDIESEEDDDVEGGNTNRRSNDTEAIPQGGASGQTDEEIEITGSNSLSEGRPLNRIRRYSETERGLRRRLNPDEDEIEIVSERPAEQELGQETIISHPQNHPQMPQRRFVIRRIHTPIGVRQSYDEIPHEEEERRETQNQRLNRCRLRRRRPVLRRHNRVNYRELENYLMTQYLYHEFFGNEPAENDNYNAIDASIMARIERDNEQTVDKRLQSENAFNKKCLKEKVKRLEHEIPGFSHDIHASSNICCVLCGVTLGEGIPEDFEPDSAYNDNIEYYRSLADVQAPWFCIKECFETDIDLSKRVFACKCGHVYCGRCVKNIGNRPTRKKSTCKNITIDNPLVSAPYKCVVENCNTSFKGKKFFTEVYF